jgi:hypothetical protein
MAEKRYISTYIDSQLPDYVRADHPMFVSFMEAYYEWLESVDNATYGMAKLQDYADIDETIDKFAEQFHNQYLKNFPVQLAINPNTKQGVNKKNFVKNIKKFFSNKGTEKAYNFLFQTFFNTEAELMLPKENILIASGGIWEKNYSIKTTTRNLAEDLDKMVNRRLTQFNPQTGDLEAYGIVEEVLHHPALHGAATVSEFRFKEVWHPELFQYGRTVIGVNSDSKTIEEQIYPFVTSLTAGNVGNDYQVGDTVTFAEGGVGRVDEVDDTTSGVRSILIQDYGINPYFDNNVTVLRNGASAGTGEEFTVITGSVLFNQGRYINNKGFISDSDINIQDSYYYQPYSYVIKSEMVLSQYKDLVKQLIHPAGMELFSSVQIRKSIVADTLFSSRVSGRTVPFIGHYTPYTFGTVSNLGFKTIVFDGKSRYGNGYNPTLTSAGHCYGSTGGLIVITNDNGYTGGEFEPGDEVHVGHGKTATVFNFNTISHLETGPGNMILKFRRGNYEIDDWFDGDAGDTAYSWLTYDGETGNTGILRLSDFTGATFGTGEVIEHAVSGITGTIDRVGRGNGTVIENSTVIHDSSEDSSLGGVNHPETGISGNAFPLWHSVEGSPVDGVPAGFVRNSWVIFNHPNRRAGGEVPGNPALGSLPIVVFNNEETSAFEFNMGGVPKPAAQALNYPYVGVSGSTENI